MSSFLERIVRSVIGQILSKAIDKIFKTEREKTSEEKKPPEPELPKTHPWRLCPVGQHWVREHELTIPESSKGPEYKTIRRGTCRINPSKREFYIADEFREIAKLHFESLRNDFEAMPIPDALDYPNGNKYDLSIAGWTKFWNETLNPEDPITPDFVKAFMSTESEFITPRDQSSNDGPARGLLQITESTRKILQDQKGEVRNHLIKLTIEESREPELSIAAGIRWLYHKRSLIQHRLKRKVTWEEAGAEYKGIYNDLGKNKTSDDIMKDIKDRHKRLKAQRKTQKNAVL